MTIAIGESMPSGIMQECTAFDEQSGCPMSPASVEITDECQGKTIVLFGVPGAFTPTCSQRHLPGFIEQADALHAAGVDAIWCMAVNDAFVMAAWGRQAGAAGKVRMLADGNAEYTQLLRLERDLSKGGMGIRCRRFAMIIVDGIITWLGVEGSGEFGVSSAEHVLEVLRQPA